MNSLVMVIEHVDVDTGETLHRSESTDHGWDSPDAAVKHWRNSPRFTAYENGRVTRNEETGVEVRAYFDVPATPALFDLEPDRSVDV